MLTGKRKSDGKPGHTQSQNVKHKFAIRHNAKVSLCSNFIDFLVELAEFFSLLGLFSF